MADKKESLASKFVRETESFLMRFLHAKGLVDDEGRPVDQGANPLEIDHEGRVVYVTEGFEVTKGFEIDNEPDTLRDGRSFIVSTDPDDIMDPDD